MLAAVALVTLDVTAQTASGCQPSACKPGNTKMEEAAVISALRIKVIEVSSELSSSGKTLEELTGQTEQESLQLITDELIRLGLAAGVRDFHPTGSGALLVGQLNEMADRLISQNQVHN